MSTNIGNLKVSIGADTADLARGIGRAKAHVQSFARVAKVGALAAGAAFVAAGAGMAALAKGGLANVDAQAKMARSVDGSIDALRALQLAGADAGVATGDMNQSVQMMGKRLAEAARDGFGPAHEALEMLNLSATDLMQMDVDARFGAIADAVNGLGLNAAGAADVMRQFGVRSNEVALALLQGSGAIRAARDEVDKFGLSLDAAAAAGVERANDAFSRVRLVFESLSNQLAVNLAPILEKISVDFQNMATVGGPLQVSVDRLVAGFSDLAQTLLDPAFVNAAVTLGTTVMGAVVGLSKAMTFLIDHADLAGTAMIALGGAMAFFSGPIGLAIAAVSAGVFLLSSRLGTSATAADEAALAEARLSAALDLVDTSNTNAVASGETLIATHIDEARAALEAAKAELTLVRARQQAGESLLDQNPLTAGGNSGMSEAMAENTAKAAAELDAAEAQLERYQKMLEGFKRSQFPSQGTPSAPGDKPASSKSETPDSLGVEKLNKDLASLVKRLDPAQAKLMEFADAERLLTEAKKQGIITNDEYLLRMEQLNEAFKQVPENTTAAATGLSKLKSEMGKSSDVAQGMAGDISNAIGNLITRLDGGKDALRQFGIELLRILAVRGISKLLGGSDWTGGLWSVGANALGTDNWKGGMSWVGERGPELVNLPRGAQVIPNNKIGNMGGGASFTYAPTIDARGASLEAVQELDQRMRADAAQFNGKVIGAVKSAQMKRAL